jgi:hypothetical protein
MGSERVESEGFYEMQWDCDHCGAQALLGKSQRHCPECGAPQNPDKRYFPSPEQQKRVDGHRYEGGDRHCPSCSAPMGATANNCSRCGSPLDGSKEVQGVVKPVAPPTKRRAIWPYVVAGIVLVCVLVWWFFLRTKEAQVTVSEHRWKRTIAIEKYDDYKESAWRDQMPADARTPLCHRKQRSTKKVEDGEECTTDRVDKKDGTFEQVRRCKPTYRNEPVEDDWCTFSVRRWKPVDELTASGTGMEPAWPASAPSADVTPTIGALRAGARKETLTLGLGKGQSCDVKDTTWRKYADGASVKVEVRARSGDVVCGSL